MKLVSLIILFAISNISFGQTIEQIKSDQDAIAFIANLSSGMSNFRYPNNPNFDSLKHRKWDVADFNKDGKADLLITGTNDDIRNLAYVVLTTADSKYDVKDLTPGGYFLIPISVVQKVGDDNIIILRQSVSNKEWSDTMVYKFGSFLKYNASPKTKKISLLHYTSTGCLGSCPIYKLIIDSSTATLEATRLEDLLRPPNDSLQGTYYSKLDREKFNELNDLVNYIDLLSLKSLYTVSITDQSTGIIEVVFTDGSFKRIDDYGKVGTRNLEIFHEYLDKLRFTQSWKKKD